MDIFPPANSSQDSALRKNNTPTGCCQHRDKELDDQLTQPPAQEYMNLVLLKDISIGREGCERGALCLPEIA